MPKQFFDIKTNVYLFETWTPFDEYQTYQVDFFPFKLEKTARLWKNVEFDFAFTCNISVQIVSLKTTSNWAHTELIAFYWNSFVMSPNLMRGNTGGLANEKVLSKSYFSSKQELSGLKTLTSVWWFAYQSSGNTLF